MPGHPLPFRPGGAARRFRLALPALLLATTLLAAGCDHASLSSAPKATPLDAAATAPDAGAARLHARVLRVADGDSFDVRTDDGRRFGVRIGAIDAPERSQPWADASRRQLGLLIADREVVLQIAKHDGYGRAVARVFVAAPGTEGPGTDGHLRDVAALQLEAGLAWFFRRYADELPPRARAAYAQAEQAARRERKGLWQDAAPVAPWDFRQSRRAESR